MGWFLLTLRSLATAAKRRSRSPGSSDSGEGSAITLSSSANDDDDDDDAAGYVRRRRRTLLEGPRNAKKKKKSVVMWATKKTFSTTFNSRKVLLRGNCGNASTSSRVTKFATPQKSRKSLRFRPSHDVSEAEKSRSSFLTVDGRRGQTHEDAGRN